MTAKSATYPANDHTLAHKTEIRSVTPRANGGWLMSVQSGDFRPPEGFRIVNIDVLGSATFVAIERDE